jgi:cathepsin A (carboxypeptidase C)
MRLSTSALVLGAASSALALQDQKVLGDPSSESKVNFGVDMDFESWATSMKDSFGELTADAKALWDEVSLLAPDAMEAFQAHVKSIKPKKNNRKPDSHWDHVVKGADVQNLWVESASGESRRKVGGKLSNYGLRAKKVDPAKLGVDSVKQFSGYLDDDEKDKHLFYCKCFLMILLIPYMKYLIPRRPVG